MTISTQTRKTIAAGDGIVTAFNFSFQVRSAADLQIYYTAADGTLNGPLASTLYSVSLNAIPAGQLWSAGGSVTYPLSGSAIATGTKLTIVRNVALLQSTSFINQGNYFPQSMEQAVDLLTMEMQQVLEIANRALVLPIDSAAGGSLPNPIAGYALGWDPTATFITNLADVGNVTIPISIVQGGTGATSASTALAALGGLPLTGGTMTGDLTIVSTDAGAGLGPSLNLFRDSASPAANDIIGLQNYTGRTSTGVALSYASINTIIIDPTNGTEDAALQLATRIAGTKANRFLFGAGLYSVNATSGDTGADTFNSGGGYYVNGVRVPDTPADQATMEAAINVATAAVPGNMKWHPGVAKAFVSANLSTGTPTITVAYNVTSLGDNGAGLFTTNFTTAFSTANYVPAGFVFHATAYFVIAGQPGTAPAAGSCACAAVRTSNETPTDVTYAAVAFFGDQ